MKARVERDWITQSLKVWFYQRGRGESMMVLRVDGDRREWEDVAAEAVLPEPSLVLSLDEAEALLPELSGVVPPNTAQADHLADTVKVRDRLLSLIERGLVTSLSCDSESQGRT